MCVNLLCAPRRSAGGLGGGDESAGGRDASVGRQIDLQTGEMWPEFLSDDHQVDEHDVLNVAFDEPSAVTLAVQCRKRKVI